MSGYDIFIVACFVLLWALEYLYLSKREHRFKALVVPAVAFLLFLAALPFMDTPGSKMSLFDGYMYVIWCYLSLIVLGTGFGYATWRLRNWPTEESSP